MESEKASSGEGNYWCHAGLFWNANVTLGWGDQNIRISNSSRFGWWWVARYPSGRLILPSNSKTSYHCLMPDESGGSAGGIDQVPKCHQKTQGARRVKVDQSSREFLSRARNPTTRGTRAQSPFVLRLGSLAGDHASEFMRFYSLPERSPGPLWRLPARLPWVFVFLAFILPDGKFRFRAVSSLPALPHPGEIPRSAAWLVTCFICERADK